ncbi:MAG TPA: GNAT family N-acetyltransferase [Thermoanaerobaculia bacterium]|nr:GNAT family N-acetyltransferase [Thermoanaerobaculia bacterium]
MAPLSIVPAVAADASALATLHTSVAERLTRDYGKGHWSSVVTAKGVLRNLEHNRVLVARDGERLVGTLSLVTKKPWAIDPAYFTAVRRPLYLLNMAVDPQVQRSGIGRFLVEEAKAVARAWPAEAIRLDAYDAEAGAGGFYAKCGFQERGRVVYREVPLVYFEALVAPE